MDDLTRDAIAAALGDEMSREPAMERELRQLFESRKLPWVESILRQADKPSSARFVDNPNGTAPGLICQKNGKTVIALPGPKGEFNPMAYGPVREFLCGISGEVIRSVLLRVVGMGESYVESLVQELMSCPNPSLAPYANLGEVHLRVTARATTAAEAEEMIAPVVARIREIIGDRVLPLGADDLEQDVISLLIDKGFSVAVSESMTGGELAARLSKSPGSSQAFLGGAVVYTAGAKTALGQIEDSVLQAHGLVDAETAKALADHIRELLGSTFGIGIVGNAGPASDAGGKPIGLLYVAISKAGGTEVKEQKYGGGREDVRRRTTQFALTWLRDILLAS
jgi:nicotinamide-nucleotide amidase